MKNQRKAKGLLFTGRVPKSNVTIYYRNGDFVVRPAHSEGKAQQHRQTIRPTATHAPQHCLVEGVETLPAPVYQWEDQL